MTVDRLRREVSMSEYVHWSIYFARKAQKQELARLRAK